MSKFFVYRIINYKTNQLYVGQSSAKKDYERIFDHFGLLKSGWTEAAEAKEFFTTCLGQGLKDIVIEVYDESNNYGYPKYIYDKFFSMWKPGDKAVRQTMSADDVKVQGSDLNIHNKQSGETYTRLQILDAAEILHILNAEQDTGCRLVNAEMGGQTTSWYFARGTSQARQMSKTTTPQEAKAIMGASYKEIVAMQTQVDKILKKKFYSAECLDSLAELFTDALYDNFEQYLVTRGGKKSFARGKLFSEQIWNKLKDIIFTPDVRQQLSSIGMDISAALQSAEEGITKSGEQLREWFYKVFRERVMFSAANITGNSRKDYLKQWRMDLKNFSFLGDYFKDYKEGKAVPKEETIPFTITFSLLTSSLSVGENWWIHKAVPVNNLQSLIRDRKKEVAFNFFNRLYKYTKKEAPTEVAYVKRIDSSSEGVSIDYQSTLMEKMKAAFIQTTRVGDSYILDNWKKYYADMVSILLTPWKWDFDTIEQELNTYTRTYYYAKNKVVTSDLEGLSEGKKHYQIYAEYIANKQALTRRKLIVY